MSKNKTVTKDLDALKQEDIVQAVVVTDNFNDAFFPMTNDGPACLLPIVNTCLLDHTLEFLSYSGVQEVFLFCCRHADKVKNHLKNSKYSSDLSPLIVNTIVSETCCSLGDAMRDLDAKGLIRGNFILLMGDTVGNINLLPILEKHKRIQKQDKGLAMTLVYKYAGQSHATRAPQDDVLLAVDSKNSQVLFHQKRYAASSNKKIDIPMEVIMDRPTVDIYNDLLDTHISVCSPSVLPLFSDNFDFQTRDDFIKGLLMNEEILASTLTWYCLSDHEYAASVNSWHMYRMVTQNIIHRWTYPLVPDVMIVNDNEELYLYLRGNVYKQPPVTLSKGCVLEEDCVIGGGSIVGESSTISRSVIGRNCLIGKNVVIEESCIWDGCIIEDDCVVRRSVVGYKCILRKGTNLAQGCILGPGVECPPDIHCNQRVQATSGDAEQTEQIGSAAFIVHQEVDNSDSEDGMARLRLPWNDLYPNEDVIDGEEAESDASSEVNDASSRSASPVPDDTNLFYNEVVDSLTRGFEDRLHCDNLILEINSSRYAYNVSMREVNLLVVRAILSLPQREPGPYLPRLWPLLSYFTPILVNYVRNVPAQGDCLQAIQEVSLMVPDLLPGVARLLNTLYSRDILSEEVIIRWFEELAESPDSAQLSQSAAPFIQWLQEAEEESGSEGEESD